MCLNTAELLELQVLRIWEFGFFFFGGFEGGRHVLELILTSWHAKVTEFDGSGLRIPIASYSKSGKTSD